MPIDSVIQDFLADVAGYVDGLGEAIAMAEEFAQANHDALGSVAALQAGIDALHGKDIEINVDTGGLGDIAGLAGVDAQMDDLIAHTEATKGAIDSLAAQTAADSAVMAASMNRVADAASDMGTRSVLGWAPAIGWMRLTGTTLHWLIAGSAEFLAVFIPAMVAAGSAAAVMAEGVGDAKIHLMAMYDAQEATAGIFHTTMGEMVGMKDVLQQAQTAADPHVYELLGDAINVVKHSAGGFVQEGTAVLRVLDGFGAEITGELTGALGDKLHGLLSGGVRDLTEFGQVLGNAGHAVINLASDMPGLARVLLAVLDAGSQVLEWLSSMPGKIITAYMALEEFNRWGSLIVGGMGRMGLAADALSGSFFTFGSRTVGILSNLAKVAPMAFGALTSNIGSAMTAYGRLGGEIEEGDGWFTKLGKNVGNAGMAVRDFGADVTDATVGLSAGWAAAIAVAAGAYVYLGIKAVEAGNALDKWASDAEQAVQAASDLRVIPTITSQMADAATHYAQAQQGVIDQMHSTQGAAGEVVSRYTGMTTAMTNANAQVSQAASVQGHLTTSLGNTLSGAGYLSRMYGTTFVGALGLADAAGVKLQDGITGQGTAAVKARLEIAGYMSGMEAMGESATTVGHDVTLLGIDSALSASQIQKLNQAFADFVDNSVGGTGNLGAMNESIRNIGSVSQSSAGKLGESTASMNLSVSQSASALQSFGQTGSQVWQNFDTALSGSASQLVQWFQTAGQEGAVGKGQFTAAMQDIVASFVPFASKSKAAQAELVAFANAAGLSAKNFPDLVHQLDAAGASGKGLAGIVEDVTGKLANMNDVAKALGSSVSGDLVSALNAAKIAADHVTTSAENFISAWNAAHAVNAVTSSTFDLLYDAIYKVTGSSKTATGVVDGLAQSLGATKGQIQQLNNTLPGLAGNLSSTAGVAASLARAARAVADAIDAIPTYKRVEIITDEFTYHSAGGARAAGGPVEAAIPYLVGEAGRELFVPDVAGHMLSNPDTERFLSSPGGGGGGGLGAGSAAAQVTVHSTVPIEVNLDGEQLFQMVKTQTAQYNTRNGNSQSGRLSPSGPAGR